jgi:hypothetical protein
MRVALACFVLVLLAGCRDTDDAEVRGWLMARGYDEPIVRITDGDLTIDDAACDKDRLLVAFAARNGAGLLCAGEGLRPKVVAETGLRQ